VTTAGWPTPSTGIPPSRRQPQPTPGDDAEFTTQVVVDAVRAWWEYMSLPD